MKLASVRPKEVIDVAAGLVGLLFDRFEGELRLDEDMLADFETPADDLTRINGIGPAFARRLAEAGVTTYAQLAGMTAEEIRQRAQLAGWQGDPQAWINQATALKAN